jgi:hypothetical protein
MSALPLFDIQHALNKYNQMEANESFRKPALQMRQQTPQWTGNSNIK